MKHDSQHIYNLTWNLFLQKWQHQYKQIDQCVIKIKHQFQLKDKLEIINLISWHSMRKTIYSDSARQLEPYSVNSNMHACYHAYLPL